MLVLSRRPNEQIVIGHDIRITVVEIRGNRVKLGITAPAEVAVHRHEVGDRLRQAADARATEQPVTGVR